MATTSWANLWKLACSLRIPLTKLTQKGCTHFAPKRETEIEYQCSPPSSSLPCLFRFSDMFSDIPLTCGFKHVRQACYHLFSLKIKIPFTVQNGLSFCELNAHTPRPQFHVRLWWTGNSLVHPHDWEVRFCKNTIRTSGCDRFFSYIWLPCEICAY